MISIYVSKSNERTEDSYESKSSPFRFDFLSVDQSALIGLQYAFHSSFPRRNRHAVKFCDVHSACGRTVRGRAALCDFNRTTDPKASCGFGLTNGLAHYGRSPSMCTNSGTRDVKLMKRSRRQWPRCPGYIAATPGGVVECK